MSQPQTAASDAGASCPCCHGDRRRPRRWTKEQVAALLGEGVTPRWAREHFAAMIEAGALRRMGKFLVGAQSDIEDFFLGRLPRTGRRGGRR